LRKDFLSEYNAFLLNKAGVSKSISHMFSSHQEKIEKSITPLENSKNSNKSKITH